jgi:hypothetical protein
MTQISTLTDIPARSVQQVIEDFKSQGARVVVEEMPDGKWTVKAIFPDGKVTRPEDERADRQVQEGA